VRPLREFLATCAWIGYIPGLPGTCASAASLAVFVLAGFPSGPVGWYVLLAVFLVGIFAMSRAVETFGAEDPGPVVIDEFLGMWLALLIAGSSNWVALAAAFVLFRFFDIIKPFPIRRLERLGGWRGIVADDLAAGFVAGIGARLTVVYVLT
jgi:phosphatidylglycerophosphatase A